MPKAKKETEKKELKKHSAAIQIEGKITLLQRKTWNVLLWNAYDELPKKEVHSIPVQTLASLVGYNSHDCDYLKEATKAMLRCIVEWDILDKDGAPDWGATTLLAQVRIRGEICTYAYSPELRQLLHSPSMYARLDLNLQKRFASKYSMALWELCTDYLGSKRDVGETPWIPLEDFRKLMGVDIRDYARFNNLNSRVIAPALDEVNRVSDFRVLVDYQRKGRKITALKFKMRRVLMLPDPQQGGTVRLPDAQAVTLVVEELQDAGLSRHEALAIWQQGFAFVEPQVCPTVPEGEAEAAFVRYVREKIHLLTHRQAAGKVDSSTGFLREALKKNYANPAFTHAETQQRAAVVRQTAQQRESQRQQLTQQLAALQTAQSEAFRFVYDEIAATVPQVLATALPAILAAKPILRHFYDADVSAFENYQKRIMLAVECYPMLEAQAPERFQALKAQYGAERAALEEQIASLVL